jgi:hypothetical protein
MILSAVAFLCYDNYVKKKDPPPQAPAVLWSENYESAKTFMISSEEAPQAPPSKAEVQVWYSEYYDTMKLSEETGKPVICIISTSNCPPCEKLKQELKSENLAEYLLLSLHDKTDKEVVDKLKVSVFPTLMVISPQYKITHKVSGYKPFKETKVCLGKPTCYCCTNPDCKYGENCLCEGGCSCDKENAQTQSQSIVQSLPIQYQPQTYSQPIQYYQPPQQPHE